MPLNLASPGIVVKEIDLTSGRVQPGATQMGAIVSPFAKGPVDSPTLIESENDLLNNFGQPYATDRHYESWMVASSYLSYGGSLQVIRADDTELKNAFVGTASSVKIKSLDNYEELGYDENTITNVVVAARNPGSWANGIKLGIIDGKADQILSGISTTSVTNITFVGVATASGNIGITTTFISGITTSGIAVGQTLNTIPGVTGAGTTVTSIGIGTVFISPASLNTGTISGQSISFGSNTSVTTGLTLQVGYGVTQSLTGKVDTSSGTGVSLTDSYLKGIITEIGAASVSVKILSQVSSGNTETPVDYEQDGNYCFTESGTVGIVTTGTENSSISSGTLGSAAYTAEVDWFSQQSITLTNSNIQWNSIAQPPGTSAFAEPRGSRFDEVHVVLIDDLGTITGNAGTVLERHLGLSKATDAEFSAGSTAYWRKYIAANSAYIFAGGSPAGLTTTGYDANQFDLTTDNAWDQPTDGGPNNGPVIFGTSGNVGAALTGGKNYDGGINLNTAGALTATLAEIKDGYDLLENTESIDIDFLLAGGGRSKADAQELANKLISVAELRKDAIAFISPSRDTALADGGEGGVTVRSSEDITTNVVSFFAPIASSSFAVFDSGYKYMYDRFANTYRYVPLNGDIAGLCARTDTNFFPWYSPAGTARGAILNAIKLAYTPSKSQRDRLYTKRINPVIFSPGAGIILFGDKTGLGRTSAFDRINVRRLFLYLEDAIARASKDVLFEFNDEITRTNFVNTIEPFLRDVQAKRGIFDYVVIADETNNTAAVIDANEFVADIYIKPARSINFIGLTFIATKTGVDFEEVIGKF
jgi:hypothetical protein